MLMPFIIYLNKFKESKLGALYYIVILIFVVICILLVSIILMQSSKTGGMGAGMAGNTALNTAFGGQGADKLLVKITAVLATLFMVLSIALNILSSPEDRSVSNVNDVLDGSEGVDIENAVIATPPDTAE